MTTKRRGQLFRSGQTQALPSPAEFELAGKDAIVRKEGARLIVEPVKRQTLLALLAEWEPVPDDLREIVDTPPELVDL